MGNTTGNPVIHFEVGCQYLDIDGQLEKIVAAGGQKMIGPYPLPDGRQFAWFKDLEGNMVGLLTRVSKFFSFGCLMVKRGIFALISQAIAEK